MTEPPYAGCSAGPERRSQMQTVEAASLADALRSVTDWPIESAYTGLDGETEQEAAIAVDPHAPAGMVRRWYAEREEREKYAAFILRAVNSHDALLAACEAALLVLSGDDDGDVFVCRKVRAAIAQAKEAATTPPA